MPGKYPAAGRTPRYTVSLLPCGKLFELNFIAGDRLT